MFKTVISFGLSWILLSTKECLRAYLKLSFQFNRPLKLRFLLCQLFIKQNFIAGFMAVNIVSCHGHDESTLKFVEVMIVHVTLVKYGHRLKTF